MKISKVIELLESYQSQRGDVPLVLYDLDTGYYFTLTPANFEAQEMEDGTVRISVGVNDYEDESEEEPKVRPLP